MNITFDPLKNSLNLDKHGVSLEQARLIEWDTAYIVPDERHDYGEQREIAIAYIGMRLHVIVYVERKAVLRIISLRKANKREIERYAET